jgi:hypothetical protein
MEDTTRLTSEQSVKLFIQRDYSQGTAVKFQERFPPELEGKVTMMARAVCSFVTGLASFALDRSSRIYAHHAKHQ